MPPNLLIGITPLLDSLIGEMVASAMRCLSPVLVIFIGPSNLNNFSLQQSLKTTHPMFLLLACSLLFSHSADKLIVSTYVPAYAFNLSTTEFFDYSKSNYVSFPWISFFFGGLTQVYLLHFISWVFCISSIL